jgi:hypothetical protein
MRIGRRRSVIEIEVHVRLIHTIEILQVGERDQPIVAKAIRLVGGKLCPGWVRYQGEAANRE